MAYSSTLLGSYPIGTTSTRVLIVCFGTNLAWGLRTHIVLSRVNRHVGFCRGIVSLPICSGIAELVNRVQLNLFVCCPFGEYELDLVVESTSSGTIRQQRTSWEIENGPDEVRLTSTATQRNQLQYYYFAVV